MKTIFLALLIVAVILIILGYIVKMYHQGNFENAFRHTYGLKPKNTFQHIIDQATGRSFTILVNNYADRHRCSMQKATRVIVDQLKQKEGKH